MPSSGNRRATARPSGPVAPLGKRAPAGRGGCATSPARDSSTLHRTGKARVGGFERQRAAAPAIEHVQQESVVALVAGVVQVVPAAGGAPAGRRRMAAEFVVGV